MGRVQNNVRLEMTNSPRLIVTPRLRQALTMLKLPALELGRYLETLIESNPVLELERPWGEPVSWMMSDVHVMEQTRESGLQDDRLAGSANSLWDRGIHLGQDIFSELLLELKLSKVANETRIVAYRLMLRLDDSGLLSTADGVLASELGVSEGLIRQARKLLASLHSLGLGCRSYSEYLQFQLSVRGQLDEQMNSIVNGHLEDLAARRLLEVGESLNLTPEVVEAALDRICSLPARPGYLHDSGSGTQYLVPDLLVEKGEAGYAARLNESVLPKLRLSREYQRLFQDASDEETRSYLKARFLAAHWLIQGLRQRNTTLQAIASSVVAKQAEFLSKGVQHLRPLTMSEVAASINVHESTVSRAVVGKYVQTPRGIYPLRFFFDSGVSDGEGQGLARASVCSLIKQLIAAENPSAPLSDQAIAELLEESRRILISRRTVAKYRREMGILPSRQRKRFHI